MDNTEITEITQNTVILDKAIENANTILSKNYLSNLKECEIIQIERDEKELSTYFNEHIRFYEISKIVFNKDENIHAKLCSVFNALGSTNSSVLLLLQGGKNSISIKLGMKTYDERKLNEATEILYNTFRGNFPGTSIKNLRKASLKDDIIDVIQDYKYVASVTDIPGLRNENEEKNENFIQGIEKVIDTLNGIDYSLLLIADYVNQNKLNQSRNSLENIYSSIVPFASVQYTVGTNETKTFSQSLSIGATKTITNSTSDSVAHTVGHSHTETNTTTASVSGGINIGPASLGASESDSHSSSDTIFESDTNTHTVSYSEANSNSETKMEGTADSEGKFDSKQYKLENHKLVKLLEKIEDTLERYDECADLGMWNCSVYCLAEYPSISQMVASVYQSVIRGKNSSLEYGGITLWNDEDKAKQIISYLKYMEHPCFLLNNLLITPGTLVSTNELSILAGLPLHSVPGISVVECAEFGRTVSTYENNETDENNNNIRLGNIYHMHNEESLSVNLDINSLASHTFITGSTGSGKSNTVYHLLNQLTEKKIKYLIIEPAKGEYKHIFGKDASVFSTNPSISNLLKINPFSFPKGIHILEHLDRLIEIFNVCWPLYAAMPAVLKEAVEKSYEDAGWNLMNSTNSYGESLYPTFNDIIKNILLIIDSSEYDTENKGAYKGSLVTRLKSLTNGINGLIFTTDEISNVELFDENVIVDLSRVGSSETKSLIMGILVLKLQEYRMTCDLMNSNLRHVTVLEEAHNLLKRNTILQGQESGNLAGKSVEILTNAIAEMRTYGEGFIIADQSPNLLDLAVIRNTNTKIIMRLPDKDDRDLVGKAANLNNEQITELARLPKGIAAVYQNEWIEPVLCKISKADITEGRFVYKVSEKTKIVRNINQCLEITELLFNPSKTKKETYEKDIKDLQLSAVSEVIVKNNLSNSTETPRFTKLSPVIKELFPSVYEDFKKIYNKTPNVEKWTDSVDDSIKNLVGKDIDIQLLRDIRQCIITQYLYNELRNYNAYQNWRSSGIK